MFNKIKKSIKKYFSLPSPVELGMSEHNALGLKKFTPFQEGPMWEDWDEIVKKKHPVKFWILNTLPIKYWWPIVHIFNDICYWIKCHFMPWKYNFFKVNLSNVDFKYTRKYGYLDPCDTLWLSAWHALISYIEKCKPTDPFSWATEEDMKDAGIIAQKKEYDESMFLYNWWTKTRKEEYEAIDFAYLQTKLFDSKNMPPEYLSSSKSDYESVMDNWLNLVREQEKKDEEMFIRVCKIRQILWT